MLYYTLYGWLLAIIKIFTSKLKLENIQPRSFSKLHIPRSDCANITLEGLLEFSNNMPQTGTSLKCILLWMYTSLKCIPQSLSFWFFLFQFPNGNRILSALYFKKPNILGGVTWVILSLTFTHSALANPVGSSFKMSFIPPAPWCNPRRLLISVAKPPVFLLLPLSASHLCLMVYFQHHNLTGPLKL